jgi:hypothetical protein
MDALLSTGALPVQSTGYDVEYSIKFEHDNAESLSRGQAQGNQQTWTFSTWVKRTQLAENSNEPYQNIWSAGSSTSNATHMYFRGDSSYPENKIFFYMDNGGSQFWHGQTPQSFRDTSAWYHIVWAVDTTQGTASNRSKIYINGEQITLDNVTYPNQNANTRVMDNGGDMYIGALAGNGGYRFNGYMAETVLIDGSQLAATEFGQFDDDSGIWKPKNVSGLSFGTRGFYLDYSDASNLGNDADGSTVFTENYLTSADQATDTPTNNFCTLNIINASSKNGGGNNEYSEGATKGKALQESEMASGTMAVAQGKWYYECKAVSNSEIMAGWGVPNLWGQHTANPGYDDYSFAVHNIGRVYYAGNAFIDISPSVSFGTSDIISVAIDIDNGFAYWAKNGTWMGGGVPTSGSTGTGGFDFQSASAPGNLDIADGDFLIPAVRTNYYTNAGILLNFGGFTTISISSAASDANGYGTFEYAPPTGYYALCTKNLAEYA